MTLKVLDRDGIRPFAPRFDPYTDQFWQELAQGRFTCTACDRCNALTFPPTRHCPSCWSREIGWAELSGRGKLYARTTIHAAPQVFQAEIPYSVGIIDLDENIRLIAGLIDDPRPLTIDQAVTLAVLNYHDGPLFAAMAIDYQADP